MNFSFHHSMILLLVCLISISSQLKHISANELAGSGSSSSISNNPQEIQLNSDEYNKMILIKYILKAYNELKSSTGGAVDSESNEDQDVIRLSTRTEKRSANEKLKDFLIKRAMKNVALGFGKK